MLKRSSLLLVFVCFLLSAKAQYQLGLSNSNYGGTNSLYLNPSNVVDSRFKLYVNLTNIGLHFSNDYILYDAPYHPFALVPGLNSIYKIPSQNLTSNGDPDFKDEWLKEVVNGNPKNAFIQGDFRLPSALININDKNAIAIGTRVRTMAQVTNVSEPLARLLRYNFDTTAQPFKDGTLSTNKLYQDNSFNINVLAMAEIALTYGREIINNKQHYLKAGVTGKYFVPLYGFYLRNNNLDVLVYEKDSLELSNTDIEYGYVNHNYQSEGTSPMSMGRGFGLDIGVTYEFRPNYKDYNYRMDGKNRSDASKGKYLAKVGASLNDLGSVTFSNDKYTRAYKLQNRSKIVFSNIQVDQLDYYDSIYGESGSYTALDSLLSDFIGFQSAANNFNMKLPANLVLTADFNIYKGFYANLTYIQSLRSKEVNGLRGFSLISVMPRFESRWFDASMPIQFTQDFKKARLGMYMRGGPFWIGTDNLNSLISSKEISGADIYFGFSVPIHRKKPRDRDKDEVSDKKDLCKEVAGLWKFKGCPDTDEDGIPDSKDSCIYTPGIAALHGCPDADGDGIMDSLDRCPENAGPIELKGCPDTDGDSIPDVDDKCPEIKGQKEFQGCPDRDGDGIYDMNDSCPDKPGLAIFNGCPDRDNDSIPDNLDKCPDTKGLKEFDGCPDSDGDKVPDHIDLCPLTPGTPENNGCPKVEVKIDIVEIPEEDQEILNTVFANLEFATGSSTISESSLESLDQLAELLIKRLEYNLYVAGHTDNVGSKASNLKLSKDRANAIKTYLVEKGIDASRITTEGFGQERPVAPNTTEEGRQKNRRVEFRVIK